MSLIQLEQANALKISIVTSNPQDSVVPILQQPPINPGWVTCTSGAVMPNATMGWTLGVTAPLGSGLLKYSIKNEQGQDILYVDSVIADSQTTLILKSLEGVEVLRLVPSSGARSTKLVLPSGESLGDIIVETKTKKDKSKDGEKQKDKKDKKDKKKDKEPKSPKLQYLLKNSSGLEKMNVSLKSKPKDMTLKMKIKSVERKGEICTVESTGASNTFEIQFKSGSDLVQNEKLYATGAVIGIVQLERAQSLNPSVIV